jgi:hypothetical protein
MTAAIRASLIKAGVRNLKEFGYPMVNEKNILTDDVFKRFFVSMLRDNLGKGADDTINALLKELGEEVDAG